MNANKMGEYLSISPVIPVVTIDHWNDAVPLANALIEGGIKIIEITLRTPDSLRAIEQVSKKVSGICIAAGTVNNADLFNSAIQAGSHFLVSPGMTQSLLQASTKYSTPLLPGASSPSEVMQLLDYGFYFQKFFPAEASGGTELLKSLAGPLNRVEFCPTGGIGFENIKHYLKLKNVICAGSSWIAERELIRQKNWLEISRRANLIADEIKRSNPDDN